MDYSLDGVTLTQGELTILVDAMKSKEQARRDSKTCRNVDADTVLQKLLVIERAGFASGPVAP